MPYADPEKARAYAREWAREAYAKDPQKFRDRVRVAMAANPELHRARYKAWALANPEHRRDYVHQWYLDNQESELERARINRKLHPEWSQNNSARRRMAVEAVGSLTPQEWKTILDVFGHACAYCLRTDRKLSQDHVIGVSRGGDHTAENVVPACMPCNQRKCARPVWSMAGAS
jgi:5-methylcytosine-specific restriction endonuclease McrA